MAMSGKENAAGVIECNASKDFVNSLICDWFCVVSFSEQESFHPFIWIMQRTKVLLQKRKNYGMKRISKGRQTEVWHRRKTVGRIGSYL